MKNKKITVYDIVAVGIMAAFVFVATFFFKIKLPTPAGSTMIKLGNGFCVLSGLLLGGWRGGIAAGLGCALFDMTDPEFAPGAWLTFVRYFIMAGATGVIAYAGGAQGRKLGRNTVAAIVGSYLYSAMYIGEKVIGMMLLGSGLWAAIVGNSVKIFSSLTNATAGVVVALALAPALRRALDQTTFGQHVYNH